MLFGQNILSFISFQVSYIQVWQPQLSHEVHINRNQFFGKRGIDDDPSVFPANIQKNTQCNTEVIVINLWNVNDIYA